MDAREVKSLAEGLLGVALAAGRVQMAHFARGVSVETKPDCTPVTVADRESEEQILKGLERVAPGVAVIAEEQRAAGRTPSIAGTFFLVDPLDGTKGFIRGRSEFTINIALVEERRPVFGLVYAPALADFSVTLGPSWRPTRAFPRKRSSPASPTAACAPYIRAHPIPAPSAH